MIEDPDKIDKVDMDKVYKKYKEMKMNPQKLMDELGIDVSEGDQLGMGVVRKETDLNNDEKQFLLAVERGDIPTARHFLEESQIYFNININCVDPLGRTALLIAIENENIEMIELLLSCNVEIGDSLLHAISEENVEAVEMLLAYQQNNKKDLSAKKEVKLSQPSEPIKGFKGLVSSILQSKQEDKESGFLGGVPSSSFTPDITPIILAAHRDNYEIIKILLDRGDRIPKPHDEKCHCTECVTKSNEDSLNHSRSRINAYRALSSPSLIALSSKDPILTTFELSWELKRLSRLENEFKLEYEGLAQNCQSFAVDLLDQTRGSKELEMILNFDPDGQVTENQEHMNLARLKLAIKYKQKKFVAHPSCQQLLASLWYEGLPGFRRRHIVFKVLLTVAVCLLYPALSLLYLVFPKCSLGLFMRRPFIKFICHSASYMSFLFLLVLASQRIESIINIGMPDGREGSVKKSREVRGAPPTAIEWMILGWVFGLVWAEIKQLWDEGAKSYIQDMWNILDFITNSLYISTFTLKLVAYLRVEKEKLANDPVWKAPREDWDAYDPNLIAEGLFAAANIFSSLKLIYIFTVNSHLGPLQISLGRMVMDIMKWGFIMVLVVVSYSCGVNQLYWYYAEARQQRCNECVSGGEARKDCECERTIANLFEIMQTLYFATFGLIDLRHFEIREGNHEFTQFVGKLMFGTYSFIMIIVLLNMLIAMLSNSFQIISNDADTEWKYARSKLWMSYFEEGGTVPPPFNVIPTPKTIYYILVWIKDKMCQCSKRHKRSKWQSIRKLVKKLNERETQYQKVVKKVNERDAKYQLVMRDLVKRYIMKQQKSGQREGVTEDDLNEIKQDISSFRYELLEILRSNGMKTPNMSQAKGSRLRRKGSRMSMERLQRQINIEPIPEDDPYSVPTFLRKSGSVTSTESGSMIMRQNSLDKATSRGKGKESLSELHENTEVEDKTQDAQSPTANCSGSTSRDEGLGESFDQQSEMSDSSQSMRASNGFNGMDSVPEEKPEDGTSTNDAHDQTKDNVNATAENKPSEKDSEIVMDPAKLPYSESADSLSDKDRKKVSFYGGEEEEIEKDPISDTFVYDGKAKSKFGGRKGSKSKK